MYIPSDSNNLPRTLLEYVLAMLEWEGPDKTSDEHPEGFTVRASNMTSHNHLQKQLQVDSRESPTKQCYSVHPESHI